MKISIANIIFCLVTGLLLNGSCKKGNIESNKAYRVVKKVTYNNTSVNVVIDKPVNDTVDVLVVYHGTVNLDSKILEAANTTLDNFKKILSRKNIMVVSVAYPEEGLLMGDNVKESEAALLWVKFVAATELGITVKKVFMAGHSQGGYIVTILNTMHATNGVIANAPGPLDLAYRCGLEENGQVPNSAVCSLHKSTYGNTTANPASYLSRSLISYTNNFKSDILFVQGLNDAYIHMRTWPTFKQQVQNCTTCKERNFIEVPGYGHPALFESPVAIQAFNDFINR